MLKICTIVSVAFLASSSLFSGENFIRELYLKQAQVCDSFQKLAQISNRAVTCDSIDYIREIAGSEIDETLYFVDFQNDSGFAILDRSFCFIDWRFAGDYSSVQKARDVSYQPNGLVLDGDFVPLPPKTAFKTGDLDDGLNLSAGIYNDVHDYPITFNGIPSFLAAKYNIAAPTIVSSGRLSGLSDSPYEDAYTQFGESVYVQNTGSVIHSEGNCTLVSYGNALAYYSRFQNYTAFPNCNDKTTVFPVVESDFASVCAAYGFYPISNAVEIDSIYSALRTQAMNAGQNWVWEGMTFASATGAFQNYVISRGYDPVVFDWSNFLFPNEARQYFEANIGSGNPSVITVSADGYYGNHQMVVVGWREYVGIMPVATFTAQIKIYFVSVFDGRGTRWYDIWEWSDIGEAFSPDDGHSLYLLNLDGYLYGEEC